jgi:RNA polymerase sigma factor for flagellar operon FliA
MDTSDLWAKHAAGDRTAREKLILAYLPLVKAIARKTGGNLPSSIEFDDLVSYGTFGMIESLDRFDPSLGNKFETFAMKRIQGSIIDGLRAM